MGLYNLFLRPTKLCSDLKCKEFSNTTSIFHIKLKIVREYTQSIQANIIEIDSLYPADLKKCLDLILVSFIYL